MKHLMPTLSISNPSNSHHHARAPVTHGRLRPRISDPVAIDYCAIVLEVWTRPILACGLGAAGYAERVLLHCDACS